MARLNQNPSIYNQDQHNSLFLPGLLEDPGLPGLPRLLEDPGLLGLPWLLGFPGDLPPRVL